MRRGRLGFLYIQCAKRGQCVSWKIVNGAILDGGGVGWYLYMHIYERGLEGYCCSLRRGLIYGSKTRI